MSNVTVAAKGLPWQVTMTGYLPIESLARKGQQGGLPVGTSKPAPIDVDGGVWYAVKVASMPRFPEVQAVRFTGPVVNGEDGLVNLLTFVGFLPELGFAFNKSCDFRVMVHRPSTNDEQSFVLAWRPVFALLNTPAYQDLDAPAGPHWNDRDFPEVTYHIVNLPGHPTLGLAEHMALATVVTVATVAAATNTPQHRPTTGGTDSELARQFAYSVMGHPANLLAPQGRGSHGCRDWHRDLTDCLNRGRAERKAA